MELIALAVLSVLNVIAVLVMSARSDARVERLLESQRLREDGLLDRIQAPSVAAAQSLSARAADVEQPMTLEPAYVSAFDDEQWEAYEAKKQRLEHETRELIGEFLGDASPPGDGVPVVSE